MRRGKIQGTERGFRRNAKGGFRKLISSTNKTGSFRENSNLARKMS